MAYQKNAEEEKTLQRLLNLCIISSALKLKSDQQQIFGRKRL